MSSPPFSATVYSCSSSRCSSVDRCPHSGITQEIATPLGRSRLHTHTRPLSAHPIGHSSSCLYSSSIILISDSLPRCMLGFSWLSAPGMLQKAASLYRDKKIFAAHSRGQTVPALPPWQDLLMSMISLTLEISFSIRGLSLHPILRSEWLLPLHQWPLFDHFLSV